MDFDPDQPRDDDGKWSGGGGSDTASLINKKMSSRLAEDAKDDISASVMAYQSAAFDSINNELRYDNTGKFKHIIENLDKAAVDKTHDTLYRGLSSDFTSDLKNKFGIKNVNDIDELKSKLIGKKIKDKAFMSTTRDLNTAKYFMRDKGTGKPAILQIDGPKTGIEVSKYVPGITTKSEKEFLIKRGTEFVITEVRLSKTGKLILNVEQ